jgi:predicted transcriptional regulator
MRNKIAKILKRSLAHSFIEQLGTISNRPVTELRRVRNAADIATVLDDKKRCLELWNNFKKINREVKAKWKSTPRNLRKL